MSKYTLYKRDNLDIQGIIETNLPISNYLYDDIFYINGSYKSKNYYLKNEDGSIKPYLKDNFSAEVVSLSVFNDLNYYTIFNNVPENTEIYVDGEFLGSLTANESFEYATDKLGEINIIFKNDSFNLSSQIFTLTSYEI